MDPIRSQARAWTAVERRDAGADGRFVYGVATTGVFCRPSCAARRPLRRNVRFFATPADARRAGYRACRRCRPEAGARPGLDAASARVLERLAGDSGLATLAALSAETGTSPFHLQRRFRAATGLSPRECAEALRAVRLRRTLRAGAGVAHAGYAAGFGSSRGVARAAREGLGMTAGRYARGGAGLRIGWTVERSALGRVLVATTDAGVCAVFLGDDPKALAAELRREFPRAELARGAARTLWVRAVLRHLADARVPLGVPLDGSGTPFQLRVWRALRTIPPGATRTYGDVAASVGSLGAARAVGSACARNVLAVLVPCHRVVRAGGATGPYRWGADRKVRLLARERSARRTP